MLFLQALVASQYIYRGYKYHYIKVITLEILCWMKQPYERIGLVKENAFSMKPRHEIKRPYTGTQRKL